MFGFVFVVMGNKERECSDDPSHEYRNPFFWQPASLPFLPFPYFPVLCLVHPSTPVIWDVACLIFSHKLISCVFCLRAQFPSRQKVNVLSFYIWSEKERSRLFASPPPRKISCKYENAISRFSLCNFVVIYILVVLWLCFAIASVRRCEPLGLW